MQRKKVGRPNLTERRTVALETIALNLSVITEYMESTGISVSLCTRNGLGEIKWPMDVIVHKPEKGKRK